MRNLVVLFVGLVLVLLTLGCKEDEVEPISPGEQFVIDLEIIDNWILDNGITDTLVHEDSRITYTINEIGTGIKPRFQSEDTVMVDFEGRLLETGEVFDSGTDFSIALNRTIPGWQIMLPEMREGDVFTIYLASIYGYGSNGRPPTIPPDAILIFDIKLIRVGN